MVVLIALSLAVAASAKDSVKEHGCKQFEFEGAVTEKIRSGAVKSLDAMIVFGGRRRLFSMELELPNMDPLNALKAVHLSAFFRPLELDAVECQDFDESGTTRCYVRLPGTSMQASAVFESSSRIDFAAAMRDVAVQVERFALDCD